MFCGGVHRDGVHSWLLTGKFQSKAAQRDPLAAISCFEKGPNEKADKLCGDVPVPRLVTHLQIIVVKLERCFSGDKESRRAAGLLC